jgi:hypothetical protein
MPKTLKIPLKKIVQQIDKSATELSAARQKVMDPFLKNKLAAKLKGLNEAKKQIVASCGGKKGYTIIVPVP